MLKERKEYHLRNYSRWKDIDKEMSERMRNKFGMRFLDYRQKWQETYQRKQLLPFPLQIGLEVIDACNYSCEVCYRSDYKGSKKRLSLEKVREILEEGSRYDLPCIAFGAGAEPLLHKGMMDMVSLCQTYDVMDIFFATNGVLLTEAMIDQLIEQEVSRLHVSLDAASAQTYLKVRGGNLEPIERMIRYCAERKEALGKFFPIIRVSFVEYEKNAHEAADFVEKWKHIADKIDVQTYVDFGYVDKLRDIDVGEIACPKPWQMINVWANGDMSPCCSFYGKRIAVGNVWQDSVKFAWDENQRVLDIRQGLLNGCADKACHNCFANLKDV